MKKVLWKGTVLSVLSLALITSCQRVELIEQSSSISETESLMSRADSNNNKELLKEQFAFALMNVLNKSPKLREIIKAEALTMFNKDYEVLVHKLKNVKLENGITFEENINQSAKEKFSLSSLLYLEPTLTIMVPELPEGTFSAKSWEPYSEVPAIAIRTDMYGKEGIPMISPELEKGIIPHEAIPGFPVLVVKNNERVVSQKEYPNFGALETDIAYKDEGIVLKFLTNDFSNKTDNTNGTTQRITSTIDPKISEAYHIYEQQHSNVNGWHRDYIYYNITPASPNGSFKYDFQEHITTFRLSGDPMRAYEKITDQNDPRFNNGHRINRSHWTGGHFEFRVSTIINAKNGVGSELVNGFTVSPNDLFHLEYEVFSTGTWFWKKRYFRLKNISLKTLNINLPLINWDLEQYSTAIRINIEEVDDTTTITESESTSSDFATNFGLDVTGVLSKLGLKFGVSQKQSRSHSIQFTKTLSSDPLGNAIVNFADKVIIKKRTRKNWIMGGGNWVTRDYTTGHCEISVEPKRVQ